jgi:hypothetical protein
MQACLKDGTQEGRLVLAIKPVKPLTGAPGMLADLVATEADAGHGEQAATQAVPGLALDKVGMYVPDASAWNADSVCSSAVCACSRHYGVVRFCAAYTTVC